MECSAIIADYITESERLQEFSTMKRPHFNAGLARKITLWLLSNKSVELTYVIKAQKFITYTHFQNGLYVMM